MNGLSTPLTGAITIALIVVLGIFIYPWLLRHRRGRWIIALMTVMLVALFVAFQGSGSSPYSLAMAAGWALGPVLAAALVARIGHNKG